MKHTVNKKQFDALVDNELEIQGAVDYKDLAVIIEYALRQLGVDLGTDASGCPRHFWDVYDDTDIHFAEEGE